MPDKLQLLLEAERPGHPTGRQKAGLLSEAYLKASAGGYSLLKRWGCWPRPKKGA